jgi:NitT/TauT family transport system substrate-binding protein
MLKRNRLFTFTKFLVPICTTVVLLSACNQSSHQQNAGKENQTESEISKKELVPITIAQFSQVFLYLPIYIAQSKGFFEEEGLKVKLVSTGGDEKTFTAVATGNAQFGVADPTFVAIAREKGTGGKVVASIAKGIPFWLITFRKDIPTLKGIEDLAGYKIATISAPSTNYAVMSSLLKNKGKSINAKIIQGSPGSLLAMLQAGKADLALEIEPTVSIAIKNGAHIVYTTSTKSTDFAFTGLTVSEEYLKQNGTIVQKVINALGKSMDFIHSDFPNTLSIAQKTFPEVDGLVVKQALQRLIKQNVIPRNPQLDKASWDKAIALRKNLKDLEAHGNYEENVDMTFAKAIISTNRK